MCRLFAQLSTAPRCARAALVCGSDAFVSLSARHSDGWGLGAVTRRGVRLFKSSQAARQDPAFESLARSVRGTAVVAHVRKATVGAVARNNAHPFRHGRWLFAHNGSLFGFAVLRPRLSAATAPELRAHVRGTTDSEALFYYLLTAIHGETAPGRVAAALRRALGRLFGWAREAGLEPPKVSFVLTDGQILFAQRGGMELHLAAGPGVLRFASQPTDQQRWLAVPEGCMVVASAERIRHLLAPPEGFAVSWPAPLSPPPTRPNVSLIAA